MMPTCRLREVCVEYLETHSLKVEEICFSVSVGSLGVMRTVSNRLVSESFPIYFALFFVFAVEIEVLYALSFFLQTSIHLRRCHLKPRN